MAIVVTFVATEIASGKIDASITERPETPRTRASSPTTAAGSPSRPMRQVEVGWW